ncbi:EF-hand calcium-binding domain-containing protein 1 [Clonorchis sinensis]|uniref:EF-hand calcium-binding domain-containing protein 1 n=1 Tax=Clonorchis sinensis TaxID=79923 RepID=A0A8T1LWL3_CLOSI|nr:EF-hand calcium-binding domain-containing protein 1 [Clonorchis sinensis]
MLEVSIRKKIAKLVLSLENQVKFTRGECEHLLHMFVRINNKRPFANLDRLKFRETLHHLFNLTDDLLLDGIFRAFDYSSEGGISPLNWIKGLSVFLRGTLEEKALFAFKAYDFNSDGILTREEMFLLLKSSLVKQPTEDDPDEGIRDLVDIVFKRLDMDRDGRVIFQDFLTAVQDDPLLLEILGPCFPEEKVAAAFLSTFQEVNLPVSISYLKPSRPTVVV